MAAQDAKKSEITSFIESWRDDPKSMKQCFLKFYEGFSSGSDVHLGFVARPGVSYSLRPRHRAQQDRELFAMVDVIDDDPQDRWLSVCFYEDMITDPEGRGEVIPGGLAGSDGYCFDLYDSDAGAVDYIVARLKEAEASAARS
jgi:hypothetical protein